MQGFKDGYAAESAQEAQQQQASDKEAAAAAAAAVQEVADRLRTADGSVPSRAQDMPPEDTNALQSTAEQHGPGPHAAGHSAAPTSHKAGTAPGSGDSEPKGTA